VTSLVTASGFKSSQVSKNLLTLGGYPGIATIDSAASNDGAGLIVSGAPAGATDLERYEKSVRWRNGDTGMSSLGKLGGYSNESYWDVNGGGLRLSHLNKETGSKMGYHFRVNNLDELEIVRVYDSVYDAAGPVYDVVSRFGLKSQGATAIASGLDVV
jgi:hypothetical protein